MVAVSASLAEPFEAFTDRAPCVALACLPPS